MSREARLNRIDDPFEDNCFRLDEHLTKDLVVILDYHCVQWAKDDKRWVNALQR